MRWLLLHYGWGNKDTATTDEMRDLCLDLLNKFPALIIVDDADSLEGEDEAALEFFLLDVPATASKVLVTSRRKFSGLGATTTVIEGFGADDGASFIKSRAELLGLDLALFSTRAVRGILEATDGSPLFIEELLRLHASGVRIEEAIRAWKERGGEAARRYALEREFEMLSVPAQKVLATCAASETPVSLEVVEAATGISRDTSQSAIEELQRLFLVPKPRLIEDVEGFALKSNTRSLVLSLLDRSDLLRKVRAGLDALSGDVLSLRARRGRVSMYIRQAIGLVKQDRHEEAENTLKAGLEEYPNDPGIVGQLGWIYKNWKPRRVADAREQFNRGKQLHCPYEEMYVHWAEMEAWESEWTKAAEAADFGLEFCQESHALHFWAGNARGRLGRDLVSEFQPRAGEEFNLAIDHLRAALRSPEDLATFQERQLQSKTYRSLCLTLDSLTSYLSGRDQEEARRSALAHEGLELLHRWQAEHPDDFFAKTEAERLQPRFERRRRPSPSSSGS